MNTKSLLWSALLISAVTAELEAQVTYRIFATREGLVGQTTANGHVIKARDHFCALPSRTVLDANGAFTYTVNIYYPKNGRRVNNVPIWDVGPWNTKDNYWHTPRQMWTDLARGLPEAQAAYYSGYNGGRDEFGRLVANGAGIDLADGTFWDDLGMSGNDWVEVTYNWETAPPPANTLPPRAASQGKNDFNGDGKADVVTFVRGGGNAAAGVKDGDVYVALSSGTAFGGGKWHEFFCIGTEVPDVGDFNGDGKSDIVTFVRGGGNNAAGIKDGDVYVGLSTGAAFGGGAKWHEFFSIGNEVPMVGDFNGDGKDDIVTFVRGPGNNAAGVKDGDVYVALSSGTGFGAGLKWHEFFCIGSEIPGVGDVNGDGKDDIITFVRGGGNNAAGVKDGDVYVALSTGNGFGPGLKWSEFFCVGAELPAVADVNGDGKADLLTFLRGTGTAANVGDVYVALSNGSAFLGGTKWQEFFCIGGELPGAADFTGDGKADLVSFLRGGGNNAAGVVDGDVYVAPSNGAGFLGGAKWHEFFSIGSEVPLPSSAF